MPAASRSREVQPRATIAARRKEFAKKFVAREIEEAAIGLFAERGYENVTVADIADAIGVSRRTFFRYFASKDEVLRAHAVRLHTRVVRALERRPHNEPGAAALCNAFLYTADVSPEERESMLRRNRVLRECQGQAGADDLTEDGRHPDRPRRRSDGGQPGRRPTTTARRCHDLGGSRRRVRILG
jgi:AcrR family transcriptional regulator